MTYSELMRVIHETLPSTKDSMHIDKVRYDRKENRALFSFLSDTLISEKESRELQQLLVRTFPMIHVAVSISCPALADAFRENPDRYALPLNQMLLREFPAVRSWEFDLRWICDNGSVCLEVPDEFALRYLKSRHADELLSDAIRKTYRYEPKLHLRVAGDAGKRLKSIEEERARAMETVQQSMAAPVQQKEKEKTKRPDDERIRGRKIADPPVDISEITNESGVVTVRGKVLKAETREISGGEAVLLTFYVTDFTGTICCKAFLYYRAQRLSKEEAAETPISAEEKEAVQAIVRQIKPNMGILIRGEAQFDNFSHETMIRVKDISRAELPERADTETEKRIELHLHTQMSTMDATASPTALIERAAKWGHEAVAITDHGVVQAFPEAFSAAKKAGIKLLPGMEGYLTEDPPVTTGGRDQKLDDPIVVLDLETTGLNIKTDRIIEIGAVKMVGGHVIDSMNPFVDPEIPLPEKITEITHITDQMLYGAPKAAEILPKLLEFIGDCPIAAHNAKFDCGVLTNELKRIGISYNPVQVDTLMLARKLYPELKTHKLGSVCKHLHVSLKGAHRAVNDASATAVCLARMMEEAKSRGVETIEQLNRVSDFYTLGNSYHIIILAATQKGIENLNHLVSESHLHYFRRKPMIPRQILTKYREGLILGSACAEGELFEAVLEGNPEEKLEEIAKFYDFLEIQPRGNNAFLVREGRVKDDLELQRLNQTIVRLGEKLSLPVCATGDVHFLDPQDAVFRSIIQAGQGFSDADQQPPLYLKTTREMLDEFSYLGEEKCREVVIKNPHLIASRVEQVSLYPKHPEGKTTFSPFWEDAEHDITSMTWGRAHDLYGEELPEIVQKRLEKELKSIIGYGYATLYSIANKLVSKSLRDGYVVGSRGSVGSSLVACMCGITEVNALPPHYRCPVCHRGYFDTPKGYTIGVDLPDKPCPACGRLMEKDGFDIPFEVFLGFKGDKVPDIDLNFSGEYQPTAHNYVKELFGENNVFRAGTIGALAEKTAYGYVLKYLEERGINASEAEKERLAEGCVGVKRTTGQHPAGMVVLPKEYDICQFTAIQYPADDPDCGIITTHFDFSSMHDILVKLDILGHDDPTMLHMLEELTGVNYKQIPLGDKKVMSLFCGTDSLGVSREEIDCNTGTLGVPEFGTSFVRQMLEDTKPTTMQELIRISGLSHGTDVWLGNAKDIIDQGIAPLSQCLCTRDDIMNQLMEMGVEAKMSFDIMESVRKGKGLKPEMEEAMNQHQVPDWFIGSCKKIQYMFPKGHAVAYVTMALRVAWYKVYRPLAYYAAYFTIRGDGFDAGTMILPDSERAKAKLKLAREAAGAKQATAKDKEYESALEMVVEMMCRGYRFLPPDLYRSDVKRFIPREGQSLLVPFTAIAGLGESVAQSIVDERKRQPFISVEDLKNRTRISNTLLEMLREQGCLRGLPEYSQVTLF